MPTLAHSMPLFALLAGSRALSVSEQLGGEHHPTLTAPALVLFGTPTPEQACAGSGWAPTAVRACRGSYVHALPPPRVPLGSGPSRGGLPLVGRNARNHANGGVLTHSGCQCLRSWALMRIALAALFGADGARWSSLACSAKPRAVGSDNSCMRASPCVHAVQRAVVLALAATHHRWSSPSPRSA